MSIHVGNKEVLRDYELLLQAITEANAHFADGKDKVLMVFSTIWVLYDNILSVGFLVHQVSSILC